ncbi:MAG: DUF2490 domain-containing protein [Alistipes sp.]|nr:DUF2490 domain-containing protein [Alistipes sp.]
MKRLIVLVAALVVGISAFAQDYGPTYYESSDSDLQGRFKVGLEIPVGEKVKLGWNEQLRTKNSFQSLDKILSSVSVGYTPWKFLEVGTEYSFVNEWQGIMDGGKIDKWRTKHRWNIDITEKLTAGRFELSLRERVRMEFSGHTANKYVEPNPFTTMRTRLKAAYKNPSIWKPYAYVEVYTTLNAPKRVDNCLRDPLERDNYINRVRLVFGTELKVAEKSKMDIHYMLNLNRTRKVSYYNSYIENIHDAGDLCSWSLKKVCAHVICVDYKFTL